MLKSKSFLCIDFGATTLKVAEFEPNETGSLRLKNYGLKFMGQAGFDEANREATVLEALKALLAEGVQGAFDASSINVCAPGFQVFSKFVKLPATDPGKVSQIIQYEAQQNVPFPLDEVVWDYQILGTAPSGELEVLLVAIKTEVVESFFRTSEQAALDLNLVDVSSAALCNAYRFNYGDAEGCVMLLDIGARSSNLLFSEQGRVYSRSINIGANSITQDFANEVKISWEDAEKMKIEEGFVSLGGAYEEPSNPNQALISKIARQVMTRLHIQMNQTIQFYRGQQGGSAPTRLYLAGGASLLPYTAQFFAEKLNLPVDYFNPFRNIQIDPEINLEEMAKVAHQFGEVVGLGIRNLAQCPVELNLMPASHLKKQQFNAKRIYFIGSVVCVLITLLAFGWFHGWTAGKKRAALAEIKEKMGPLKKNSETLKKAKGELDKTKETAKQFTDLVSSRAKWSELLAGVQEILVAASTNHNIKITGGDPNATNNDVLASVWIEKMDAVAAASGPSTGGKKKGGAVDDGMGGMLPPGGMGLGMPGGPGAPGAGAAVPMKSVGSLNLTCRALNLKRYSPSANREFIESLQTNFVAATNLFLAEGTQLTNRVEEVELTNHTFSFSVTLQLKEVLKF